MRLEPPAPEVVLRSDLRVPGLRVRPGGRSERVLEVKPRDAATSTLAVTRGILIMAS